MPSAPRSVAQPDYPCSIQDAITYLEALRTERPAALISRIVISEQRPDYAALADAVRARQPYRGSLTVVAGELFPDMPERAAHNLVSGARRAGYIHNRATRARPAWYASERGGPVSDTEENS